MKIGQKAAGGCADTTEEYLLMTVRPIPAPRKKRRPIEFKSFCDRAKDSGDWDKDTITERNSDNYWLGGSIR